MKKSITDMSFDEIFPEASSGKKNTYSKKGSYSSSEDDENIWGSSQNEDSYDYSSNFDYDDYGSDISSFAQPQDDPFSKPAPGNVTPPQSFDQQPQSFTPPPQNFSQPQGFTAPPQNFSQPQGFTAPPQNFSQPQSFTAPPQNFNQPQNINTPPVGAYDPGYPDNFVPQPTIQTDDIRQTTVNIYDPNFEQNSYNGQNYYNQQNNFDNGFFTQQIGNSIRNGTKPKPPVTVAFIFSIMSIIINVFPIGLILAVVGLVLSIVEHRKAKEKGTPSSPLNKAASIICIIGIIFGLLMAIPFLVDVSAFFSKL